MKSSPNVRSNHLHKYSLTSIYRLYVLLSVITFATTGKIQAQSFHLMIDSATGKFSYEDVVKSDSTLSDTFLFERSKEWAVGESPRLNKVSDDKAEDKMYMQAFLGVNYANFATLDQFYKNRDVIKMQNLATKKIILHGVYKYTGAVMSCLGEIYTSYDVIIQFRKGRAKIEFTNFNCDIYSSIDAKPTPDSGKTLEQIIDKANKEMLKGCRQKVGDYSVAMQNHCNLVYLDFKKFLSTLTPSKDDDW